MKHPLTITLTTICLISYLLQLMQQLWFVQRGFPSLPFSLPVTYYPHATLTHFLLYHFSHANIFHLLANLYALYLFKPRATTILASYLIATIAAYLDTLLIPTATCGLSAFLFASFARNYVAWHRNLFPVLIAIAITAFLPNLNWHVHLLAFALSYLFWLPIYHFNSLLSSVLRGFPTKKKNPSHP